MSITQWVDPEAYPHMYYYVTDMNGHLCGVRQECDWGGPCDWCATCSCGWKGTVFTDAAEPGERGAGSPHHALAELLEHAGFDPALYDEELTRECAETMARVRELASGSADEDLDEIDRLVAAVRRKREGREKIMQAWLLRKG